MITPILGFLSTGNAGVSYFKNVIRMRVKPMVNFKKSSAYQPFVEFLRG